MGLSGGSILTVGVQPDSDKEPSKILMLTMYIDEYFTWISL
jgi:hypothetical protein